MLPCDIWRALAVALCLVAGAGCAHEPEPSHPNWGVEPPPYPGAQPQQAPASSGAAAQPPSPSGSKPAQGGRVASAEPIEVLEGEATYYGDSLAGHATASGEPYRPEAFTAAHRTLPFGSVVRVVREDGGQQVVVRINDRGPFGTERRIIDVSRAAAEKLDMLRAGVVPVRVEVLERPAKR